MGAISLVLAPFTVLVSERQPWWGVLAVLLALFGLVIWLGKKGWKDEGDTFAAALLSYGGTFAFHLIDSAVGDGGWNLFDKRNIYVALWAFVAWTGFMMVKYNREQEEQARREKADRIRKRIDESRGE
ncbi:hypothetical protein [Streptomyces xylophagus]|uniref:hypothetical protein n=1 Tax=Streptomyces xylophagus TaxID=285514 RepID=UPI00131CCBB2|nr:hypothetical protein [Streptomyces xylophagus]